MWHIFLLYDRIYDEKKTVYILIIYYIPSCLFFRGREIRIDAPTPKSPCSACYHDFYYSIAYYSSTVVVPIFVDGSSRNHQYKHYTVLEPYPTTVVLAPAPDIDYSTRLDRVPTSSARD